MNIRFAGLDWASRTHAACVIDEHGNVHLHFEINHDAAGLAELCRSLARCRGHGRGHRAPLGPDRRRAVGGRVLGRADSTPTSSRPPARVTAATVARATPLTPTCWPICCAPTATDSSRWRLRATTSARCVPWCAVATTWWPHACSWPTSLRSLLQSFWPGATKVFADVDSLGWPSSCATPRPESAARLGPKRMAAFCAQHAYSGRRSAHRLLDRLHQAPAVQLGALEMEAKGELALSLARTLDRLVDQIRLLSSRIEHHVGSIDDGRTLMSFPRG